MARNKSTTVPVRKYADRRLDEYAARLRKLGTPDGLSAAGIFGTIATAFHHGYYGNARPRTYAWCSAAWVAYYAGRDSAEQQRRRVDAG